MSETRPPMDALFHYYCEFDALALLHQFHVQNPPPNPTAVTNFLGAQVEPKIFPPILGPMTGQVEGLPIPGNWHADIAEWAAALRTVALAKETYRIVELGCGWGCWLVNMGVAARALGLRVELIGVEGDPNHLQNAASTLALNGFDPSQYTLTHGIAAAQPGHAIFPNPEAGSAAWGGEAIFFPDNETLKSARKDPSKQVLDCYTLETLGSKNIIDLLHIDIQGAELDYAKGNQDQMSKYVRRVLIGTHSRVIEGALQELFLGLGWRLEMDRPVIAPLTNGRPVTGIDGVQLWGNPDLT